MRRKANCAACVMINMPLALGREWSRNRVLGAYAPEYCLRWFIKMLDNASQGGIIVLTKDAQTSGAQDAKQEVLNSLSFTSFLSLQDMPPR